MRFQVKTTEGVRKRAKSLKRYLTSVGYETRLSECHELLARMLGYASYHELHHSAGSRPQSASDYDVDDEVWAARRSSHIAVLMSYGIATVHAATAVDIIGPTRYRSSYPEDTQENASDFEQEWGLRASSRADPVVVVTRSSRPRSHQRTRDR
jgi:hypothetical protein